MVGGELPRDPEDGRDPCRGALPRSVQGVPDAQTQIAEAPVLPEQVVLRELLRISRDVVPGPAVRLPLVHEAVAHEDLQMMPRRPDADAEGAGDGPEVIAREEEQVFVQPAARRLLELLARPESSRQSRPGRPMSRIRGGLVRAG